MIRKITIKVGGNLENTIRFDYYSPKDRYIVTISDNGHNFTSIPIFECSQPEDATDIIHSYVNKGYVRIPAVQEFGG